MITARKTEGCKHTAGENYTSSTFLF